MRRAVSIVVPLIVAPLIVALLGALLALSAVPARADDSKLAKEAIAPARKAVVQPKNKVRGGYPLSEDLGFALRFYWLAREDGPLEADSYPDTDLYTEDGFYLGSFSESFVRALRMEGSGLLADGRVVNYAGRCRFGVGTCFHELDRRTHPFGRGAGRRALQPFKSVAVDPRVIPIGEPIYIPEFDGLRMPDGHIHDGCVRADDTGGGIKKRKMDFFVVSLENFRYLLGELWGVIWITPHIEVPRCEYLRDRF